MTEIKDEVVINHFLDTVEIWAKENIMTQQNLVIDHFALKREAAFHPEKKAE